LVIAEKDDQREIWLNDVYRIKINRHFGVNAFGEGLWSIIQISARDGSARHDWRDMQAIKNQMVGEEWEALEIFPAESRLIDPSNCYLLYCFQKIPIGMFQPRCVLGSKEAISPQRGWIEQDEKPNENQKTN
jgi:hypothetical protein